MSEQKVERPVKRQEILANVKRWRIEHGFERPDASKRQHYERKINTLDMAFKKREVAL